MAIVPDFTKCENSIPENITHKYWKADSCEDKHKLETHDLVQFKEIGKDNIIYCESFKIHVYNKTVNCPNFPFSIPRNVQFNIGDLKYNSKTIYHSSLLTFDNSLTQRVNFFLMPQLHSFDFNSLEKEFNSTEHEINIINWRNLNKSFWEQDIDAFDIMIFIFIICLIVGFWYIKRYFMWRFKGHKYRRDLSEDEVGTEDEDVQETELSEHQFSGNEVDPKGKTYKYAGVALHPSPVHYTGERKVVVFDEFNGEHFPPHDVSRNSKRKQTEIETTDPQPSTSTARTPFNTPDTSRRTHLNPVMTLAILLLGLPNMYCYSESLFINIEYKDPCHRLLDLNLTSIELDWCDRGFYDSFLMPLDSFFQRPD